MKNNYNKIQALAKYLNIKEENIKEDDNQKNFFLVNERKEKRGSSPEYYYNTIIDFKKLFDQTNPKESTLYKRLKKFLELNQEEQTLKKAQNLYNIIEPIIKDKPTVKDWLYNSNILFWLLNLSENKTTTKNLKDAFLGKMPEDTRELETVNDGEYYIFTDEEANEAWDESLNNYIDECMEIPDHVKEYFDREGWKEDARGDGRGHSLSPYNGKENSEKIDGIEYFIYRHN
jgi:hypothetical protein